MANQRVKSVIGGLLEATRGASNAAPVPYVSRRATPALGSGGNRGAEAQMRAFGSVGTLHAIVSRLANATSSARWRLWKTAASGLDEDRTEVTRHAALDIWRKPNPFYTQQELVESSQQHQELVGECVWVVARSQMMRSLPLELWCVRPDRIVPVPHAEDFLAGYIYLGPDGERVPLEVDEVIHMRLPNPLDPYRGLGPVQALLTDLDSVRYSAEWNRNFFINSATPGGIIEVPNRLDDDEWNEITARWRESHQGVANAHRVGVIENGAKWVDRSYSMRDMQFTELREVSREVIREAFGFPKPLLGTVEDVNRANAEAGEVVFARWLIVPRLQRIRQALNNDFLPMFGTSGQGLEFDFDDIVPADREADNAETLAKATAAKTFIDAGFDARDVCELLELPEMGFEKPAPPPAFAPALPGQDQPGEKPAAEPKAFALPWVRNDASEAARVDLTPVQVAWEKALERLLRQWGGVTGDQIDQLADQISDAIADGDLERLSTLRADSRGGAELLAAAMVALGATAAGHVVAEAAAQGVEIQPVPPGAGEMAGPAAAVAALLAAGLALSAGREALRVHRAGSGGREVAGMVREYLVELTDAEPRRALGGALTGAQNTARLATLKAAPTAALYASEQLDGNTCGPCREVNGRWLGNTDGVDFTQLEKTYPFGGYVGCLGRERCRGAVVGVWRPEQTEDR